MKRRCKIQSTPEIAGYESDAHFVNVQHIALDAPDDKATEWQPFSQATMERCFFLLNVKLL